MPWPTAKLKLIAGILGIPYDELRQRERDRQRMRNVKSANSSRSNPSLTLTTVVLRQRMSMRLCLACLRTMIEVALCGVCWGSEWTNLEGKTITASFVRLSADGSLVVIQQGDRTFEVALEQLSEASKTQAQTLQKQKAAWAQQELLKPIFSEDVLLELANFSPSALSTKQQLVRGRVVKILRPESISRTQPRLELEFGTVTATDLTALYGEGQKLQVTEERVSIWSEITSSGLKRYRESEILVTLGQIVVIRSRVEDGKLIGLGLIDATELRKAPQGPASQSFVAYLAEQAQLHPAEKPSNSSASPTPPSTNDILQWLLNLLGQSK